ncbi:MAG: nucleoside-diphosphate kinase, partial [Bdellovibrionota bacterium]
MTSAPVVLMVLEGANAVEKNRQIMGATNPAEAKEGTLRKLYAKSIEANAVHGSDSSTSAEREINYFFDKNEIFGRF